MATLLKEKFEKAGIPVKTDSKRGLDHGSWTLLYRMFPKADIPIIQVSVNPYLDTKDQYKIGEAIQDLGKEGILVIGSGVTVHNLGTINWDTDVPEPWAIKFDDWMIEKIKNKDLTNLFKFYELAPKAKFAVPTAEHFVPLIIAFGSGKKEKQAKVIYRHYDLGTLSYLCFEF